MGLPSLPIVQKGRPEADQNFPYVQKHMQKNVQKNIQKNGQNNAQQRILVMSGNQLFLMKRHSPCLDTPILLM
jgi:hypothetical protein